MSLTVPKAGIAAGRAARAGQAVPNAGAKIAQLGDNIATAATAYEDDRLSRQMARRQLDVARDLNAARLEVDQLTDPDQIETAWPARLSELRGRYIGGVDDDGQPLIDPKNAERFNLAFDGLADQHALQIARRGLSLRGADRSASRRAMAGEAIQQSATSSAGVRDNLVSMALGRIVEDHAAGLIGSDEAEAERVHLTDNVEINAARSIRPVIAKIKKNTDGRADNVRDQSVHGAKAVLVQRNTSRRGDQDQARRNVEQMSVDVLRPEIPEAPVVPDYDPATARAATVKQQAAAVAVELNSLPIPDRLQAVTDRIDDIQVGADVPAIQVGMEGLQRVAVLAQNGALVDDPGWALSDAPITSFEGKKHKKWLAGVERLHGRSAGVADDADLDGIQSEAEALLAQGAALADAAGVGRAGEVDALMILKDGYEAALDSPDIEVMRRSGADLPELPDDIRQMAGALVDRISATGVLRSDLGLSGGDDLDPSEVALIADLYSGAPSPERVRFLSGIAELDIGARLRLAQSVGVADGNLADAVLAGGVDPLAAANINAGAQAGISRDDLDRARVLGGDDAVTYATALSRADIDDPAGRAVAELASPVMREALDVVTYLSRDEAYAELQDMALTPEQIDYLLPYEPAPFEEYPDLADEAQAMIVDDPEVALLSEALAYVPDSPQSVEQFTATAVKMQGMDAPQRAEFIAEQTASRQTRDRGQIARPRYYGEGEITADGLKQAARRLQMSHRARRVDDATYRAQAVLIHRLAQTFPADQMAFEPTGAAQQQPAVIPANFGDDVSISAAIIQNRQNRDQSAAVDFLEGISGVGPEELPVVNESVSLKGVLSDVGRGITEIPKQIVGGVRDAAHASLTGIAAFDEWAGDALGLPKLQITDPETGEIDLRILSADQAQQSTVSLPEVGGTKTVTGGLVRGVAQFLTGFVGGQKALSAFGKATTALGAASRAAGSSAISDFAVFDAHEARLSDLVQSYPEFANPITEYLASDQDDSELEGRLKNVAEGVLSDIALTSLVSGIRSIRKARRAKAEIGGETYAQAQSRLARDPRVVDRLAPPDISVLQRSDAPLVARRGDPDLDDATRAYLKRVKGTISDVADDVPVDDAALALTHGKVETGTGDVFINWSRIDGPEDVKAVIQQMADAAKNEIGTASRGTRSNAETALSADQLNAWEVLTERRMGEAMNAEQTLALRRLWASSSDRLLAAAQRVREAPTDTNNFAFRRALALHGTIQKQVLAVRTETARALQQWAIPTGSNDLMAKQISDTVDMFGGVDVADNLANRIVAMAQEGDLAGIDAISRKGWAAATLDAVFEYWVQSLLSGAKTHAVNFISNSLVVPHAMVERVIAAKIGAMRGGVDRVEAGEALAMLHGSLKSVRLAARNAGDAFRTGVSKNGVMKFEIPRRRALSSEATADTSNEAFNRLMNKPIFAHGINAIGAVMSGVSTRALGAADEFFKTINYSGEVNALVLRRASREARDGAIPRSGIQARVDELMADIPDDIMAQAREFAQVQTFTDRAGPMADAIKQMKTDVPGVRYILPFVQTVANIMRYAARRSPAAAVMPSVWSDIRAGGTRADLAFAQVGLGSVSMLTTFGLAMSGHITGSGPSNKSERAALRRTGWQPNSIKIGDRYYAYNRVDPFGMQLGFAASMAERVMNGPIDPGADYADMAVSAIGVVGQNMLDKSYMTGLSEFIKAVDEPERYGSRYLQRFAGTFMPNVVRDAASGFDPVLRAAADFGDEFNRKIPFRSDDLPARHDLWGREISFKTGDSAVDSAIDAVSPIYRSDHKAEPIDEEFFRIDFFPGKPSNSFTIENVKYTMRNTPEIYEAYVVLQGATPASKLPRPLTPTGKYGTVAEHLDSYGDRSLREMLNAVVLGEHKMSADYIDADRLGKRRLIDKIIGHYRAAAKMATIAQHPAFFGRAEAQ